MHSYVIRTNALIILEQNSVILPHHQNWRTSPVLRNRNIYLRYYTQTSFLERIGLDKGVHVSISPISDPQMSSSASELTSFCASSSALSIEELVSFAYTFQLQRYWVCSTAPTLAIPESVPWRMSFDYIIPNLECPEFNPADSGLEAEF